MVRIGKILHPTDFSGNAREALKYAVAFAVEYRAKLHLLTVVNQGLLQSDDLFLGTVAGAEVESLGIKNATDNLDALVDEIRSQAAVASVVSEVKLGVPFVEIVKSARRVKADLIVMGTHGRSGFSHLLIGSTAEKVVRHAPCPTLTVPQKGKGFIRP